MSNKKRKSIPYKDVEINITPMIDVFSLLTTFLLMSAASISIGITDVQIPFFTNAPEKSSKSVRSLDIRVEVEQSKLIIRTAWTQAPLDKQVFEFPHNSQGLHKFHKKMVEIKRMDGHVDKVLMFTKENVNVSKLIKVLDEIKLVKKSDRSTLQGYIKKSVVGSDAFLFQKVVLGDVIL